MDETKSLSTGTLEACESGIQEKGGVTEDSPGLLNLALILTTGAAAVTNLGCLSWVAGQCLLDVQCPSLASWVVPLHTLLLLLNGKTFTGELKRRRAGSGRGF